MNEPNFHEDAIRFAHEHNNLDVASIERAMLYGWRWGVRDAMIKITDITEQAKTAVLDLQKKHADSMPALTNKPIEL